MARAWAGKANTNTKRNTTARSWLSGLALRRLDVDHVDRRAIGVGEVPVCVLLHHRSALERQVRKGARRTLRRADPDAAVADAVLARALFCVVREHIGVEVRLR